MLHTRFFSPFKDILAVSAAHVRERGTNPSGMKGGVGKNDKKVLQKEEKGMKILTHARDWTHTLNNQLIHPAIRFTKDRLSEQLSRIYGANPRGGGKGEGGHLSAGGRNRVEKQPLRNGGRALGLGELDAVTKNGR